MKLERPRVLNTHTEESGLWTMDSGEGLKVLSCRGTDGILF